MQPKSYSKKHSSDISQNFEDCISGSNLRPCGDGSRCYHRLDSCWEAACLNADCFEDHVLISDSITELDKTQVNVTVHLVCFISNAVFERLVDRFQVFKGVA